MTRRQTPHLCGAILLKIGEVKFNTEKRREEKLFCAGELHQNATLKKNEERSQRGGGGEEEGIGVGRGRRKREKKRREREEEMKKQKKEIKRFCMFERAISVA